ncbi:MAG: amino acid adenylation domain-containing protein [Rubrivivax sp.]|nr:MAG: amino acid adenylation domain-containing protein [Rubrivivax sp.]
MAGELQWQTMPLTDAQRGIWMGQRLAGDNPSYWTAEALAMRGPLQLESFKRAVDHVLGHALTLHMQVDEAGQASYPPALAPMACSPEVVVLPPQADAEQAWVAACAHILQMRPAAPDMSRDRLWRSALIGLADGHHAWVLWAHHLVLDGYGFTLMLQAVADAYSALTEGRALPDLAHWSLGAVVDEDITRRGSVQNASAARYWQLALAATPGRTLAPTVAMSSGVRRKRDTVPFETLAAWQRTALEHQVDWVSWLVAGVARCLLGRLGGSELVLGWPVMNRLGSKALKVPCMAMNIVPLLIRSEPGQSHVSLAQQIQRSLREMRPHQRYRYEQLRHDLGRMGGDNRLFGPVLNVMPFERPTNMGGLRLSSHTLAAGPVENLAINLIVLPDDGGLKVSLEANPLAYSMATLTELCSELQACWRQACDAPECTPQPTGHAIRLDGPPLTQEAGPTLHGSAVLGALARHALERADHVAVASGASQLSHAQLWAQAQQHALALAPLLPDEDRRVLVMLPRHAQTLAVILAIWLVDGCYIPLDSATPPARLDMVLNDARPHLVVTSDEWAHRFVGKWPVCTMGGTRGEDRPSLAAPTSPPAPGLRKDRSAEDAAYVIYTSGSTGRPNGVVISHGALAHFLAAAGQVYGMAPADRMLQFAPLHFDASIEELFLPLMVGATVLMRDEAMLDSPARFLAACRERQVTVLDLPTAYWHELAHALSSDATLRAAWPESIRLVIIGGEAAQAGQVRRWQQSVPAHVVLLNTYGPTEATVICSTAVLAGPGAVDLSEGIPIGTPLPGINLLVVPSEAGQAGQLLISGPTLANGYLGQEALTAARFAPWPGQGEMVHAVRAYRTGDVVRLNHEGRLVFLGRLDDEIKVSGHRVDPSEVESAMLGCAGVEAAAVLGQVMPDGGKRLVAFFVADRAPPVSWWREQLLARLPAPAVPTAFVQLDRLPRNHNNKVDRQALKARLPADAAQSPRGSLQLSSLEALIAEVWHEVLGVADLRPTSDFFALGGASLLAIRASTRLGTRLQREVPVSMLFTHPTLAALAQALLRPVAHHPPPAAAGQELAPLLPIQRSDPGAPILFCIHPAEGLSWCYFGLCRHLPGVEIWGIQSPGITGEAPGSFEALVDTYLALIRSVRPQGPYGLLGWSSGGGIAHALAGRLQAQGDAVTALAMMDAYPATIWQGKPQATEADALEALLDVIGARSRDERGQRLSAAAMRALLRQPGSPLAAHDEVLRERLIDNALSGMRLYRTAQHRPFDGPLLYFKAAIRAADAPAVHTWAPWVKGDMHIHDIDSNHNGMSQPAPLAAIGKVLAASLASVGSTA